MHPSYTANQLVVVRGWFVSPRPGDVVMVRHNELEKLKRVKKSRGDKFYVLGDNPARSTDSRHFGWINSSDVVGVVIWSRRRVGAGS